MTSAHKGTVFTTAFTSWQESLASLLTVAGLREKIAASSRNILIKPNLVEALDPPITTPVELIAELVRQLRQITSAGIIVAEGSGARDYETGHTFDKLGYTAMASELDIKLVDLNNEKPVPLENSDCRRWPRMYLPAIALESFLISVPVLKAHTLAGVTLTLKNMMGLAPPSHYRSGGSWKKSAFHDRIQEAVSDLNRYRTPDFTILDATVGMARAHLWGPPCDPPVNILAAGYDPVAIDTYGTSLLGKNWTDIGHIRLLHKIIGQAEPLNLIAA